MNNDKDQVSQDIQNKLRRQEQLKKRSKSLGNNHDLLSVQGLRSGASSDESRDIFEEAQGLMANRKLRSEELRDISTPKRPVTVILETVGKAAGNVISRTPAGQLFGTFRETIERHNNMRRQVAEENERNAIATTVVVSGMCTLASHFEKLQFITVPIGFLLNALGALTGHSADIFITKMVVVKKTQYFTIGVQSQYQLGFMIFIMGFSWYVTFRLITWVKNIIIPDERLRM